MIAALILGVAGGILSPSHATCGAANCFLVTGTQEGIANPGQVIVDLSYRFIPMDKIHSGSRDTNEAITPRIDFETGQILAAPDPKAHKELRTNNELMQVDLTAGVTPRLAVTITVPFFNVRTHEHDHVTPAFSREDGTSGFGDVRLIAKYALWIHTKHLLVGGLGIKLPTGEYKLRDHEGHINEPTIQPGTGSFDGLASLYYAYEIFPHELNAFLSGSYQANAENDLDYKMGNTFLLNTGVDYRLNDKVLASIQANMRQAPRDSFNGQSVPSTGGRWVYLTPGIRFLGGATTLYTHVQLPVVQYVNEVNLVPRFGFIMGVSHVF
jgi:hypothetical protein